MTISTYISLVPQEGGLVCEECPLGLSLFSKFYYRPPKGLKNIILKSQMVNSMKSRSIERTLCAHGLLYRLREIGIEPYISSGKYTSFFSKRVDDGRPSHLKSTLSHLINKQSHPTNSSSKKARAHPYFIFNNVPRWKEFKPNRMHSGIHFGINKL